MKGINSNSLTIKKQLSQLFKISKHFPESHNEFPQHFTNFNNIFLKLLKIFP